MSHETLQLQQDHPRQQAKYFGIPGLQRWALATLPMWHCGMPGPGLWVSRSIVCLDAAARRRFSLVDGSGGWISHTDEELLEEVKEYQKRGVPGSQDQSGEVRIRSGT